MQSTNTSMPLSIWALVNDTIRCEEFMMTDDKGTHGDKSIKDAIRVALTF